jgi:hypothetical protein
LRALASRSGLVSISARLEDYHSGEHPGSMI